MSKVIKYNFGSGKKILKGFVNVDALDYDGLTDVVWDLTKVPYKFAEYGTANEIVAMEMLEHISFRDTLKVLKEWYRILEPDGKLFIQVPDCGKMMEMYIKNEICECVPHKVDGWDNYKPNPDCWNCEGKGKVSPTRWLFSFIGAQKHSYDTHKMIFTKKILEDNLKMAGFGKLEWKDNVYKLIVNCFK